MHFNRLVPILLIFGLIPGLLSMPLQQMLVAFCEEIWEVGAAGFSTLLVVAGIGGVAGSAALGRRTRKHLTAFVMIGCLAAFSITTVGFSMSPSFWMAVPLLFAANFFSTAFGILNTTAIQLIIPDYVRGRVTSFLLFTFSFPLLACLPVGALADQWGAPYAVATIALFTLVVGIGFYLGCSRLRHLADAIPVSMPRARVPEAIPAPAK
jgi:MFS family permease